MSIELKVLLESYKYVYLNGQEQVFKSLYERSDKSKLVRLVNYHHIRPILYLALKKANVKDPLCEKLFSVITQLTFRDKVYAAETSRVVLLLKKKNIEVLPYKGALFSEVLFGGAHIRESSDIDLLCLKSNATEALQILIEDGYTINYGGPLGDLVNLAKGGEVSLVKKGYYDLHIDFHWRINEEYHSYLIDEKDLFKDTQKIKLAEVEVEVPNHRGIFTMLLNHHGGRGNWLTLKELFDLSHFMLHNPSEELPQWAESLKMTKIFYTGRNLVYTHLLENGFSAPTAVESEILLIWDRAKSYKIHFAAKVEKLKVYFMLQDPDVSKFRLLSNFVSFHGTTNPLNLHSQLFGKFALGNAILKAGKLLRQSVIRNNK